MAKLHGNRDPAEHCRITLQEAASLLPTPDGKRSVALFEHGTLQVKLYAPRGVDAQSPHTRDEIYVIARGAGWFVNGEVRHRFASTDVLSGRRRASLRAVFGRLRGVGFLLWARRRGG